MSPTADILVLPGPPGEWFDAAGLVMEWIGYPQWRMASANGIPEADPGLLVARLGAAEREWIPRSVPAILECTDGHPVDLPCRMACEPGLAGRLERLVGLYTELGNYNGMQGVRLPLEVPRPRTFPRAATRRRVDVGSLPPHPDVPLARALPDDGEVLVRTSDGVPLVARRGAHVVLGLPLVSLLASHLSAPPLADPEYVFCDTVHHLAEPLAELVSQSAPPGTCRVAPWPDDARGVFAMRHDHDRPLDLAPLVERETDMGVRPTIHLLTDVLPTPPDLAQIRQLGAEIGLHGRFLDRMPEEAASVRRYAGTPDIGHSAHGGRGADGWQGMLNLVAADRAGVAYTELLSEMHLWPHRIHRLAGGPGAALHPLAMPHRVSADASMKESDLDRLTHEVPRVFANRGLFTLMSHPDLHPDETVAFIRRWIPPDVPRMTLLEVTTWWRATHVQGCLDLALAWDRKNRQLCVDCRTTP